MIREEKLNKILTLFVILLIVFVILYRFNDYIVNENHLITVFTECEKQKNNCFISTEEFASFNFQLAPYKKVEISEADAPKCLEEHSCSDFICNGINTCKITLCDDMTKSNGELCTGPNNPDLLSIPEIKDTVN